MKTKFHPILFSTPMVQAILAGTKTQTRRIVKFPLRHKVFLVSIDKGETPPPIDFCPYKVGDVFWVRETWLWLDQKDCEGRTTQDYYKTEHHPTNDEWLKESGYKWKPSIFMPKPACRIFLKIKNIRVERLQEISEKDAIAEGLEILYSGSLNEYRIYGKKSIYGKVNPVDSFESLWIYINGNEAWSSNPFVWVYEFEKIDKPNDF